MTKNEVPLTEQIKLDDDEYYPLGAQFSFLLVAALRAKLVALVLQVGLLFGVIVWKGATPQRKLL